VKQRYILLACESNEKHICEHLRVKVRPVEKFFYRKRKKICARTFRRFVRKNIYPVGASSSGALVDSPPSNSLIDPDLRKS
jgi:hypothetical protein